MRTYLLPLLGISCLPNVVNADLVGAGNIVANSGAEAGSSGEGELIPVPGWTTTGNATVVFYGAPGGFPTAASPGPENRGSNFFAGGSGASSMLTQLIDTLTAADIAAIDTGGLPYEASAWLGGFSTNGDNAALTIDFRDAVGVELATVTLGPVTAADRNNVTGFEFRSVAGEVPIGTRSIFLTLDFARQNGVFNDGYADNLSLSLGAPAAVPEPSTFVLTGFALLATAFAKRRGHRVTQLSRS